MAYTYTAWSVVFGEQPSASKWNIIGTNMASFNERIGSNFSSGTTSPVWWEEIGRTTLSPAGDTITVSSLPARKYLHIKVYTQSTGGTIRGVLRFNADSGNNYAFRSSTNGGADSTSTSSSGIQLDSIAGAWPQFFDVQVTNNSANEKLVISHSSEQNTAGAGNTPGRLEVVGKWANTAAQISTVSVTNTGTGDYAVGSEVVVLGHD